MFNAGPHSNSEIYKYMRCLLKYAMEGNPSTVLSIGHSDSEKFNIIFGDRLAHKNNGLAHFFFHEIFENLLPKLELLIVKASLTSICQNKIRSLSGEDTDSISTSIHSYQDFLNFLKQGIANHFKESSKNEGSPRDSSLILKCEITMQKGKFKRSVILNFCEIAGTECLSELKQSIQLKIARANLESIANVVSNLLRKTEKKIIYITDPLTMILQNELKQDSKVLLLANFTSSG